MKDQPIQLARGHLFALAATSLALSVLTFFLGITVAERTRPTGAATSGSQPLLADEVRLGSLESLLARVSGEHRGGLAFPHGLDGAGSVSEAGVPTSGWAIQVGEYPDAPSADRLVAELRAANVAAYRAAALVDGRRVQRVRVSGFSSREAALGQMEAVASRAGSALPSVVPAP